MNKALLVIDVQEDYLGEKRNKKRFYYENPDLLIQNINKAIEKYKNEGFEIIYIAHIFPNFITNKLIFGFSIRGTEGAKLVKSLNIVSKNYFEKNVGNAFSNKNLCQLLKEKRIGKIVLCGIDEAGCVGITAKGAERLGLKVSIIKNATDTVFIKRAIKFREKLKKLDVKYI